MKAAVLFETKGKLSVENVDISEPKKDEVLVKIKASGLETKLGRHVVTLNQEFTMDEREDTTTKE